MSIQNLLNDPGEEEWPQEFYANHFIFQELYEDSDYHTDCNDEPYDRAIDLSSLTEQLKKLGLANIIISCIADF